MSNDNTIVIKDFFNEKEQNLLASAIASSKWLLQGRTSPDPSAGVFWCKRLEETEAVNLFHTKIEKGLKQKISIESLYVNGQAHGQCGHWHQDLYPGQNYDLQHCFTLVYFPNHWLPEYGGHLMLQEDNITSILPEYNKTVIFSSSIFHIGLEPTVFCKTQRESIACKFRVII